MLLVVEKGIRGEDFTKNQNKESDEGCFLEIYVQYPKKLPELHNN